MPLTTTVSHGFTVGAGTSLTISHASDSNPLYVLLSWYADAGGVDATDVIGGVTFNGVALTRGGRTAVVGNTMEWWRLASPTSGAHNLVISLSPSRRLTAAVLNVSGWPTSIAEHTFAAAGVLGIPPPSVDVDSRDGAEVLSWIGFNHPDQDVTVPSGATGLWNEEGENVTGGDPTNGDQRSAGCLLDGASPSVACAWAATEASEYFGVAAISFTGAVGRHLLAGTGHAVRGVNNFIAGDSNAVAGAGSEAHGIDGTVQADRSVLFSLDGDPHAVTDDGVFEVDANDIRFNGRSVADAVTGPATSTDRGIATWNGTDGHALRDTPGPTIASDGRIATVTDPTSAQDAATKAYVDLHAGSSWIPLVDGSDPPNLISDGDGTLIVVPYV